MKGLNDYLLNDMDQHEYFGSMRIKMNQSKKIVIK